MEKETLTSTKTYTIGLFGNPNCGKSTLFNLLTGLRQKVGNFPGVTVDKKIGQLTLQSKSVVQLVDFPGTYSFYPNSIDERIAVQTLINREAKDYPDAIIYVADVTHLEKHLLLFTQLHDLGLPCILVLNMADQAEKNGLKIDVAKLKKELGTPVYLLSARTGAGTAQLKEGIDQLLQQEPKIPNHFANSRSLKKQLVIAYARSFLSWMNTVLCYTLIITLGFLSYP